MAQNADEIGQAEDPAMVIFESAAWGFSTAMGLEESAPN
jgi:hypothetical protein